MEAAGRAVADVPPDLGAEMAEAQDDPPDAIAVKQCELVVDEGPPGHLHHDLGDLLGDRPKPRGQPPGKDGGGDVAHRPPYTCGDCGCGSFPGHWITTFVPSKSKRKRTSRSPSPVSTRRRRVLSAA